MAESQALPKVTPYLLRRADSMCERRLAKEYEGGDRSHDPVHRSRMRDAFLAAARDAHAELRAPVAADFAGLAAHGAGLAAHGAGLEPEERAVLAQAAHWYVQMFGDRAARWEDLGLDSPTVSPRRRLRIGGWIDLPVVTGDGGYELRQLDLWGGRVPFEDPLELEAVRVAVLRLARWVGDAAAARRVGRPGPRPAPRADRRRCRPTATHSPGGSTIAWRSSANGPPSPRRR